MLEDVPGEVIEIGRAREPGPAAEPCPLAFFTCRVEAGFPSPADDYLEGTLDLNEHLIRRPAATFFLRVSGDSMTGAGIYPGDILIVDRSLPPADGPPDAFLGRASEVETGRVRAMLGGGAGAGVPCAGWRPGNFGINEFQNICQNL